MRQSDGAEIFGANDPRSANVGVIHVAPTDDRQSVLAGILTQDKLGRKQVAVVLPEENRVFQRSVDFEGLKSMRRGLKSQIVFIMPSGSGPAEYARQRRFPVYSSLENFARTLQPEGQVQQNPKRGWSFGRRPSSGEPEIVPIVPTQVSIEREPTVPLAGRSQVIPEPEQVPSQMANGTSQIEEQQQEAQLPGATSPGIGPIAASESDAILPEGDDWHALPPAGPVPQVVDNSQFNGMADYAERETSAITPKNVGSNSEPSIIAFPTPRPKIGSQSAASPLVPIPPRNMPSAQQGNTATASASFSNRAAGGGVSPARGIPGGTGGGVGGSPRRTGRRFLFALLLLLLATLLCIGGIALAAPGIITPLTGLVPNTAPPSVTVNITPKSAGTVQNPLQNQYDITGVMGKPDPSQRQVQARQISNPASDQKTAPATGVGHIGATKATGTLTFVNTSSNPITIAPTTLTGSDGVQVTFNGSFTVQANPPTATVNAYAVNAGAKGNIAAYDIDGTCCVANNQIFVKNTSAFTGGKDEQTYSIVKQSDINGVVNLLASTQKQNAQSGLKKLVHSNENTVGAVQCPTDPDVSADHKAGDIANTVTIKVSFTCSQDVYDQAGAKALAANLFKTETSKKLDSHYELKGDVLTSAKASILAGIITVSVTTKGVWVYKFTDLSSIAAGLASKTRSLGEYYLQHLDGVSSYQLAFNGGDGKSFPDAKNIIINIVDVQGLQGPPVSTTPGPIATPTPQPGLGGS